MRIYDDKGEEGGKEGKSTQAQTQRLSEIY